MDKSVIITLGLFLCSQAIWAETCPKVTDVRNNLSQGWTVYDSDDGTRLSRERELDYKKHIEEFVLAEWTDTKHHGGSIHCYYRDKSGGYLEAYLGKNNSMLQNAKKFWYEVSGAMHCAAGMQKCQFHTKQEPIMVRRKPTWKDWLSSFAFMTNKQRLAKK